MRTIPQSAFPAIRSATAALLAILPEGPAAQDARSIHDDPGAWDADDAAWALGQAAEATENEEGFEDETASALVENAIIAIG